MRSPDFWAEVIAMTRTRCRKVFTSFAATLVVLVALSGRPVAQAGAQAALRAAMETETVKGDLRAAIAQYRTLGAGADRAVAAQALVRMAGCHKKLGDAEARAIYERVVRDFADQAEAVAAARAELRGAGALTSSVKGDRSVWTGDNVDMFGRVSPDGRYITYVDWEKTGNLAMRDLVTNTARLLTSYDGPPYSHFAEYSAISADGGEVIYTWGSNPDQLREIRRMGLHGGAPLEPVRVYAGGPGVRFFGPLEWSKDKTIIATALSLRDGAGQLATIRVSDGTLTVLRTMDWVGPNRLFLSPDARYLAYDAPAADGRRDVHVVELATKRDTVAIRHSAEDGVLGWSPDGLFLLFSSDRTGSNAIWAQAMAGGQPAGLPRVLRPEGAGLSLGLSATGTLYVHKVASSRDVLVADLNLSAGTLERVRQFSEAFTPRPRVPSWSHDGQWLAHQACADGRCVAVRSVTTGETRLLQGHLLFVSSPRWSPDGRQLLVAGRDLQGRDGIFTLDVASGAVTPVVLGPPFASRPVWSADGSKIYYLHQGLIERTLATGTERTLNSAAHRGALEVSPDGQWLAVLEPGGPATPGPARILVLPTTGGEPREILKVEAPDALGPARTLAWSGDSRTVLVVRTTPSGKAFWEVPVDGRPARRLAIDGAVFTKDAEGMLDQGFAISPDGRQIAFLSGRTGHEVWAVEHLLSSLLK
jgi:Tol biopolymer transport system component